MTFQNLIFEKVEEGIAQVTLNRPERLNAINTQVLRDLQEVLRQVNADESIKVLIITGAGPAFSAGTDIREVAACQTFFEMEKVVTMLYETFTAVEMLEVPVIAAINGYCFGAAHELALACDFSIAADTAQISYPEINYGFPSVVQAALLPRYAPLGLVRELLYTGDVIDAHQAKEWGLVNRVVPLNRLEEEVRAVARKIARQDRLGLKLQKALINRRWIRADLETAIHDGIHAVSIPFATGEPQKRLTAFLEERRRQKEQRGA